MKPLLQLAHFETIKSELSEFSYNTVDIIDINLDFDLISLDINGKILPGIEFKVDINKHKKNRKLKGHLECTGAFSFPDNKDESEQTKILLFNGLSIMYGMIRGIVFEKASSLPPYERLLPTINLVNDIKRKLEEAKKAAFEKLP